MSETAETVYTLPLDASAPFRFDPVALEALLRSGVPSNAKLVVDPDGLMDVLCAEVVGSTAVMPGHIAAAFRKKEQDRTELMKANFKSVAGVMPRVITEIKVQMAGRPIDEVVAVGLGAVERLTRMEWGLGFVHVRTYTASRRCPTLAEARPALDEAGEQIDGLVRVGRTNDADRIWLACPPAGTPRQVADYGWGELECQPSLQRQKGIRIFAPLGLFGTSNPMEGFFGGAITTEQWVGYGLPWVTAAACRIAETYRMPVSAIASAVGWKLSEYGALRRV